jgi:hypothetical protein
LNYLVAADTANLLQCLIGENIEWNPVLEPGYKTTFKVDLPMIQETTELNHTLFLATPALHGSETVLLADDEPILKSLIQHMLESYGYTVLSPQTLFRHPVWAKRRSERVDHSCG